MALKMSFQTPQSLVAEIADIAFSMFIHAARLSIIIICSLYLSKPPLPSNFPIMIKCSESILLSHYVTNERNLSFPYSMDLCLSDFFHYICVCFICCPWYSKHSLSKPYLHCLYFLLCPSFQSIHSVRFYKTLIMLFVSWPLTYFIC